MRARQSSRVTAHRARTLDALVVVAAAAALFILMVPAAASVRVIVDGRGGVVLVDTRTIDDVTYFDLAGLATAAGASRHWDATTRKMVLFVGQRRVSLAIDTPFAVLDRTIVNLHRPVLMRDGEIWVPPRFVTGPFAQALHASIEWAPGDADIAAVPLGTDVVSVALEDRAAGTAVIIGTSTPADFSASSSVRGLITLVVLGASLPDSLTLDAGDGLVESVELAAEPDGVTVRIATDPAARTYAADDFGPPYRIEVLVEEGSIATTAGSSIPIPSLRPQRRTGGRAEEPVEDGLSTVMIDPGHGGNDAGSVGPSGLTEKEVTLGVARELARALQREGYYVFMTRSSDSFVPLQRRGEIANMTEADVFVSLQCGAWHSSAASGFQVHFHSREGNQHRVATGGLVRDFPGAVSPQSEGHLWDRVHQGHTGDSMTLARRIHDALARVIDTPDRGVSGGQVAVLAGCGMPAAMVEIGYITNPAEEDLLGDPGYRQELARGIARGITGFMEEREEVRE